MRIKSDGDNRCDILYDGIYNMKSVCDNITVTIQQVIYHEN